jgi:hypothetical protein
MVQGPLIRIRTRDLWILGSNTELHFVVEAKIMNVQRTYNLRFHLRLVYA